MWYKGMAPRWPSWLSSLQQARHVRWEDGVAGISPAELWGSRGRGRLPWLCSGSRGCSAPWAELCVAVALLQLQVTWFNARGTGASTIAAQGTPFLDPKGLSSYSPVSLHGEK